MRDLILIPTFARPEYLQLCLEHIAAADKGDVPKDIWIAHDRHTYDQPHIEREVNLTRAVAMQFGLSLDVRAPHPYIGNPLNFLELYKVAYEQKDVRYVFLIEDDVLVAKDFFKWHEAVQARGDYFITVGWHCIRNPEVLPSLNPNYYIESTRDFSSIGICWKKENLAPFVKHATANYYRAMPRYLATEFPGSPIPAGQWTEQAGIVTRLLHQTKNRWVAWPTLSRVAHVGISGYHRPGGHRFSGTLEQRIADLRKAVVDPKILNSLSKDPFDDVGSLSHIPDWKAEDLRVVQRFPYEAGKI